MRLLLDTHTLLWWVEDAPQLSSEARRQISDEVTRIW
jgi:PIN domain nuclease of toxin-antitoxin system